MPKYLSDLGQSASVYGLVVAIFVGGSAIGGAIGGNLADRFGKRRVTVASLALASIPLFLVSALGWSPWYYLLIPLAGGLTGAVHSILVVMAQRAIPGGMATASGLILGFMFTAGALGTMLCGYLADMWGFPPVFMLTAGIALVASMLALTLRKN
jgi:FSR family fosmidomycin resistance protein-like MFS transporter